MPGSKTCYERYNIIRYNSNPLIKGKGRKTNSSCQPDAKHISKHFYIYHGNSSREILVLLFYE